MTRIRTYNPAARIDGYVDVGETFLATRLDTGDAIAVRLTENAPSARRPGYAAFKKGAKDPKMKTAPGGVVQFDTCRPVFEGDKPALAEGRPLYSATWVSLLAKDPEEHPVLAARPARLVEIAGKGANGEKLAFADIVEPALVRGFPAYSYKQADELIDLARQTVVPGAVEDRSRFLLVQWGGSGGGSTGYGTVVSMADLDDLKALVAPLQVSGPVEAVPVVRVFVGSVAKDNKRRIAPFEKFFVAGAKRKKDGKEFPESGFVRCNIVLGRHRLDADENEIPDATAQRFMTACSFAEFPEPALPGAIQLHPPR